jgi:flagellar protein FliS
LSQALQQYTTRSTQTASPGQLVVMLYDGFLRFTAQARDAMERRDPGEAGLKLSRAQAILSELRGSLDMSQGPVAQNLASIYAWVLERMTAARLEQRVEELDEARRPMTELRSAWAQIAREARPEPPAGRPLVGVNLVG